MSSLKVYDSFEQNSSEWYKVRCGHPTSSEFATIMARGKGGGPSITRRKYLMRLAAERITGNPVETYQNDHMRRGKEMEPEAIAKYEVMNDVSVRRIAFIFDDKLGAGASPDGIIGDFERGLEVKSKSPHLIMEDLILGSGVKDHMAQVQGHMLVGGMKSVDLYFYWPGMPERKITIPRDDDYCARLRKHILAFRHDLDKFCDLIAKGRIELPPNV
jgi:hypothetical protein